MNEFQILLSNNFFVVTPFFKRTLELITSKRIKMEGLVIWNLFFRMIYLTKQNSENCISCNKHWVSNRRRLVISSAPFHIQIKVNTALCYVPSSNKHLFSKCGTYQKYDQNLIVTKSKCKRNKYQKDKAKKTTSSYEIYRITNLDNTYLLLLRKHQRKSSGIVHE